MEIDRFSMGIGDRFGHQAEAQLKAIKKAQGHGVEITPVWNKSYREHQIIGSQPGSTRRAADDAVKKTGWTGTYFVDADHINLDNVDFFLNSCDFFTIDVADYIGRKAGHESASAFVSRFKNYAGRHRLADSDWIIEISEWQIGLVAENYLSAIQKAAEIYRHIEKRKGRGNFITEVSMDETDAPQTPVELFFILAGLAEQDIPLQTIAPKFSGHFNKGIDYAGDPAVFSQEFEQDILILKWVVKEFGLPAHLKLSVHSGSDKFSIYPVIRRIIKRHNAGLHLKTAGTTWLEELIGLAEAEENGLRLAKAIYSTALDRFEEICEPYRAVIDIDREKLPSSEEVERWDGKQFARALRHIPSETRYNSHFRQLLHVGYKVAAQMGERYLDALRTNKEIISGNVTENIYERHIKPLFL